MFRNDSIVKRIIAECITILLVLIAVNTLNAQTWSNLQGPIKQRAVHDIGVKRDGGTLYAAEKSFIFKSTNSGNSWNLTNLENQTPLVTVCKNDDGNTSVVGFDGGLYWTTTGGSTWTKVLTDANTKPLRLVGSTITDSTMFMFLGRKAVGANSSILRSTNSGQTWWAPLNGYPSGTNIKDIAPYPMNSDGRSMHVWAVGSDPTGTPSGQSMNTRGVWQSTNHGADWTYKTTLRNKNITSIAIKPSGPPDLWIGTDDGGVWFSNNDGVSWDSVKGGLDTIRVIRARNNAGTWEIYVATKSSLIKSTDNGATWSSSFLPSGASNVRAFSLANSSTDQAIMYMSADNGIWRSTNGGINWTEVNNGLGQTSVNTGTGYGTNYWASFKDQDTISRYDGSSWSNLEISNFYSKDIMRHPGNGYLFLSGVSAQKAALYRSTDNGGSFDSVCIAGTQGVGNGFKGALVSPQNSSFIYIWGRVGDTANFYKIGNYGIGSIDRYCVSNNFSNIVNDIALTGTDTIYYGLDNVGVYKSFSGPSIGTQVLSGVSVRTVATNASVLDKVYAGGSFGLKKTTNGGSTWTSKTTMDIKRVITCPGYTSSTDNIIFLANTGTHLYYSSNGGTNYTSILGNLPTPIYDIKAVAGSPATLYIMTDAGMYQMQAPTDAPTLSSPANGATDVGLIPTLSWGAVSGVSTYHVVIATDANFNNVVIDARDVTGTSYSPESRANNVGTYYWKVASSNYVGEVFSSARSYTNNSAGSITLSVGIVWGEDNKQHPHLSWTPTNQGSTFYVYRYQCDLGAGDCNTTGNYTLFATTTDTNLNDASVLVPEKQDSSSARYYYLVRSKAQSNKVSIESFDDMPEYQKTVIAKDTDLPKETKLIGSYPNPFNPVTHIQYDLKEDVLVKIVVYDMLGREVEVLVNDVENAGSHDIIFNASQLPSGVYIYRFSAGDYTAMKKLVLTK